MLSNNHTITLYINNKQADIGNDMNIRLNNVINNPTQIISSAGEYSFTFSLPVTTANAEIFQYANIPEKKNKFNNIYKAELFADDMLLFYGNLKLQSSTQKEYNCNLYNNRQNATEALFQDAKLNEFDWLIDYDGITTINKINKDMTSDYYFPLVAYHNFNKVPKTTNATNYKIYTPKTTIDEYNRWQHRDFYPSLRLSALLKKIYNSKGQELKGDILTDKVLSNLYLSTQLAQGQDMPYNIGNDKIGRCRFYVTYDNNPQRGATILFPIYSNNNENTDWKDVIPYNMLKGKVTPLINDSNMLSSDGVKIYEDGWYEIICDVEMSIKDTQTAIKNIYNDDYSDTYILEYSIDNMPLEFQLLRYDPKIDSEGNISHNTIYKGEYPNEKKPEVYSRTNKTPDETYITNNPNKEKYNKNTTLVDTANNPNFICGVAFSKDSCGLAYIKNGNSYNNILDVNNAIYNSKNNYYIHNDKTNTTKIINDYDNTLLASTEIIPTIKGRKITARTHIITQLAKNTILLPYINTKKYTQKISDISDYNITYHFTASTTIDIRPVAPIETNRDKLKGLMTTLCPTKLNLAHFINKDKTMKEFVSDICNAFNLITYTEGNVTTINKKANNNNNNFITLDDRITINEYNHVSLEYPKYQGVKFNFDEKERYAYISAEQNATDEQLQSTQWTNYCNKGFDLILLDENSTTDNTIQLSFGYCGYEEFTYNNNKLLIPIIAKDEDFINDNDYSNITDGFSLPQRFWYREDVTDITLDVNNNNKYNITIPSIDKDIVLDYKDNKNNLLSYFFNINKQMHDKLEVEVYLDNKEYKDIVNGAKIKLNDDIYYVMEIQGYDPTGNNKTKLTLFN